MDWYAFHLLNGLAGRWARLDLVMCWIARYSPAAFALALVWLWLRAPAGQHHVRRELVLRAALTALLALGLNQVVGWLHFRPRPFVARPVHLLLPPSPDPSFPSDHAAGAWAVAWSLRSVVGFRYLLLVLALAVAVARVYVGLHYPSDVIGGAVVGVAMARMVEVLWEVLHRGMRRLPPRWP